MLGHCIVQKGVSTGFFHFEKYCYLFMWFVGLEISILYYLTIKVIL